MPAVYSALSGRAADMAPHLVKRSLTVNHTQAVTLGIMAVYVVVIALLWNLPYVRWSLWPFKVSWTQTSLPLLPKQKCGCLDLTIYEDAGHRLPRVWPCDHRVLYGRQSQIYLA